MTASGNAGTTFLNARLSGHELSSVRIVDARIAGVGIGAARGDVVIDLNGDWLLPGFFNAHDHLQLNSLGTHEVARSYDNVQEWIGELATRRHGDAAFASAISVARDARLLIGGIKNLLSGVTTVAHHDPLYPFLLSDDYPVRVVRAYGWSHSLYTDGDVQVRDSYRNTPIEWPWIVHAAEGVDDVSVAEFDRLDSLGCLGANTLLVHGIALDRARRQRLIATGSGLIWCPSSNLRMFGRSACIDEFLGLDRVAIGTDSRLSGARDLLEEMRVAANLGDLDDATLTKIVTGTAAALLRVSDRGSLRSGMLADIVVLPAHAGISMASRADVKLVLIGGIVRYGDRDLAQRFAANLRLNEVRVDGRTKVLDGRVVRRLAESPLSEPGLQISDTSYIAA